jgi:branched-chain amino acid transport system substrate-binding protein
MTHPGDPHPTAPPPVPGGLGAQGYSGPVYGAPPVGPFEPRSGLPYASYSDRVGAYLIDGLVCLALVVALGVVMAIAGALDEGFGALVGGLGAIAYLAAVAAMLVMGDGGALGQTPGKHLVGIKVVGPRPGPIGYGRGTVRWLGRIVDNVVCGLPIGLLWPLVDRERRAWHDLVADTRVVLAPPGARSLGYWWRHFRLGSPAAGSYGEVMAMGGQPPPLAVPPPAASTVPAPPPGAPHRSTRAIVVAGVVALCVLVPATFVVVGMVSGRSDDDSAGLIDSVGDGSPPSTPAPTVPSTEATAPAGEGDGASGTSEADPSCTGTADGTLTIGGLLPMTGDLSFLGPAADAAARLAVEDVNAAGGVLGRDVTYLPGDSGDTDPDLANPAVDGHLAAGADVFLGPLSSGVSFSVIDKVVGACRMQVSPGATSAAFTDYADDDLYFRTAPSDALQGQAVADLMIDDGAGTAVVLARRDAYGEELAGFIAGPFELQGGLVTTVIYDPEATTFDAEVSTVLSEAPDAVAVVGFDESAAILDALFDAGVSSATTGIYLVDGNVGDYVGQSVVHAGALAGVQGTLPGAQVTPDFGASLRTIDPSLTDFSYGPEAYDAVVVTALAAAAAGTDDPAEIARHVNGITRDGEPCAVVAACLGLLGQGRDIDYDGVAGPLEFGPSGEPTTASIAVLTYGPDNLIDHAATEYRQPQL